MSIKQLRLDRGWSQEELARHAGLSTRTVQRLEAGQAPGLETLKCLASVFETSISTLTKEHVMTHDTIENAPPRLTSTESRALDEAQALLAGRTTAPLTSMEKSVLAKARGFLRRLSS